MLSQVIHDKEILKKFRNSGRKNNLLSNDSELLTTMKHRLARRPISFIVIMQHSYTRVLFAFNFAKPSSL